MMDENVMNEDEATDHFKPSECKSDISDDVDYINKDNKECVFINIYDCIECMVINMNKECVFKFKFIE